MVQALGYSQTFFNPSDPGRLCRGRERWIDPWEVDGDSPEIYRLVISGASFSDDSARDAQRGVQFAGVGVAEVIDALLPDASLLAFMEDGHPADIPEAAEGIEAYSGFRAGGRVEEVMVRWHVRLRGAAAIADALGADPNADRVRGFAVIDGDLDGEAREDLLERLFLLVGMSTLDSPPARYQPAALPEVLEMAPAVVLLHRDKHGPAVAIYAREPLEDAPERLRALCEPRDVLLVPFAIPPMLARWDRALAELRAEWMSSRGDEFPVPPATEPSTWDPRARRRGRRDRTDLAALLGEEATIGEAGEE